MDQLKHQWRRFGYGWFDKAFQPGTRRLFIFRLARMIRTDTQQLFPAMFYGLMLRLASKPGQYSRVGYCDYRSMENFNGKPLTENADPFAKGTKQTIVIV